MASKKQCANCGHRSATTVIARVDNTSAAQIGARRCVCRRGKGCVPEAKPGARERASELLGGAA